MLIKEYRIPLPLSLEEYKIAQLFMIQKKSRLESSGSDSAVEIIENSPYEDGPGGSGQYTKKIYHIGSHLPGWLISFLPKTALRVEEEAWNAYPYTKTRFSCPFLEKFFIDIETYYLPDHGQTENVFGLDNAERKRVEVDLIDPVKDAFPPMKYIEEEDPHLFVSKKTGRGPLEDDWLETCKNAPGCDVMCAYKLIKVEFKYWGMQGKAENFIQNGLRNPMLVGHRQAWSWQDEWYGLTMEDIRKLEKQAQLELSRRIEELSGIASSSEASSTKHNHEEENNESTESAIIPEESRVEFSQGHYLTSAEQQLGIHMKNIEQSESDDEFDEDSFFDALETLDDISVNSIKEARRRSSAYTSALGLNEHNSEFTIQNEQPVFPVENNDVVQDNTHILMFVVQTGCIAENENDPESKDFKMFNEMLYAASDKCYPGTKNTISVELITSSSLSMEIMEELRNIHFSSQPGSGSESKSEEMKEHMSNSFPFSLVPQLIMRCSQFQEAVKKLKKDMNDVYQQFLYTSKLEEKNVEVFIVADCIGGILVYDGLKQKALVESSSLTEEIEEENNDLLFIVSGIFFLGSPIGLVAFNDKLATGKDPTRPHCGQIYNLFHPLDPLCFRIEPIIDKRFCKIQPLPVPKHQGFPYCFDLQVQEAAIQGANSLTSMHSTDDDQSVFIDDDIKKKESVSSVSFENRRAAYLNQSFDAQWWGTKRIDYSLCCPQGIHQFPVSALVHLCYNSYWESKDLVTFILWQMLNDKYSKSNSLMYGEVDGITHTQPGKWLKRRTTLKIKNMSPNHRGNDTISAKGAQPVITGKFAYGPVAMVALSGEMIDVYVKRVADSSEWKLLGSEITDNHGRLVFTVPTTDLEPGVFSVKLVVRGDRSSTDCNMAILPPHSETVVFSVDSSFLSSISFSGINPKIRGGAVDAVRHWQELGYFIIYVSSRLLFQKYQVMSWLSEHKFPFGIVSFCDTVSTNYQKHKINFLKNITKYENITIHAAYGSSRDISVYMTALNLPSYKVFLLGKKNKTKKMESAQWITNGYAAHLDELKTNPLSKRSSNNILLSVGNFGVISRSANRMSRKKKENGYEEDDDFPAKLALKKEQSDTSTRHHHLPLKNFQLRKTKSNPYTS